MSPAGRARNRADLQRLRLDVLVIGGGVVGAGCALDAAARGLTVGLVEEADLASGTSSRSSKLIHGGLRYLEMLDFRLVAEALRERQLLLDVVAPHLVTPVSFLYPLRGRAWERIYVGAGLQLYDGLARWRRAGGTRHLPRHQHLSRRGVARVAPGLRAGSYVGGIEYYDAQVDDARLVLSLARTAAALGARVITRCRVDSLLLEASRVTGASVTDVEDGTTFEVRARQVINATGVWADDVRQLVQVPSASTSPSVRPSKGSHVVVTRDRIRADGGLIMRTPSSVLLVIPWGQDHWLIGTTDEDTPHGEPRAAPVATVREVDYLLEQVNTLLDRPLCRGDVVATWAGLRPLVSGDAATARLSREHVVHVDESGLVTVSGGKLTTYRVMARDAVDQVAAALRRAGRQVPECGTATLPLVGAGRLDDPVVVSALSLLRAHEISSTHVDHLWARYGSLVADLATLIADDPSLARPLVGAPAYLRAEVEYAVTAEGGRHLDDVLERRTRIAMEHPDHGAAPAEEVAGIMGALLGWSSDDVAGELDRYRKSVALSAPDTASCDRR